LGFQLNTTAHLACSSSGFQILPRGRDCHAEANTLEIIKHRFESVSGSECFLGLCAQLCKCFSARISFLRRQGRHCNSIVQGRDGSLEHCLSDYFSLRHQVPPDVFCNEDYMQSSTMAGRKKNAKSLYL
jgi:hypothetical protein